MVGALVWEYICTATRCDLDMTFDLAAVTLNFVGSSYLIGTLVRGCRCASSCDLDYTSDLVIVTFTCKFCLGHVSENVSCRKLICLGNVSMLNHGMTLNLGFVKMCSPAMYETYFSDDKDIWIAVTYYYILTNCAISIDSYISIDLTAS